VLWGIHKTETSHLDAGSLRLPLATWIPWGSPTLPQVLVHIAQSLLGIDLVRQAKPTNIEQKEKPLATAN